MSKQQTKTRKAKQARFTTKSKKKPSRTPVIAVAAVVAVIALGAGTLYALTRSESQPVSTVSEAPFDGDTVASSDLPEGLSTGEQTASVTAATSGHAPYPALVAKDGEVRLLLSTFGDSKARYYTYMNGDQPLEFFILESSDGVVRAAFNACDSCFVAKKGYLQEGDEMVCLNCGLRFASDQINVVRGGCNPSPLQRVVDGEMLVIQEEDIIAGATYF